MADAILTAERLRELLHYNPETGIFTWLVDRQGSGATVGRTAGHKGQHGYWLIGIDQINYPAHRLAWLYMTGELPAKHVDHIDGVRDNNRWPNLRHVSAAMNAQNIKRAFVTNKTSGLLGVSLYKRTGRWQAQITVDNKVRPLGYFDTPQLAHEAYLRAKRKLHPGFIGLRCEKADLVSDWEKFI